MLKCRLTTVPHDVAADRTPGPRVYRHALHRYRCSRDRIVIGGRINADIVARDHDERQTGGNSRPAIHGQDGDILPGSHIFAAGEGRVGVATVRVGGISGIIGRIAEDLDGELRIFRDRKEDAEKTAVEQLRVSQARIKVAQLSLRYLARAVGTIDRCENRVGPARRIPTGIDVIDAYAHCIRRQVTGDTGTPILSKTLKERIIRRRCGSQRLIRREPTCRIGIYLKLRHYRRNATLLENLCRTWRLEN